MSIAETVGLPDAWNRKPALDVLQDLAGEPWHAKSLGQAALVGAVAGLVGTMMLKVSNAVELRLTGRPDAYVPPHLKQRTPGRDGKGAGEHFSEGPLFTWGVGAAMGLMRGALAKQGVRGPYADLAHTFARVVVDQSVQTADGTSTPPWTWTLEEQFLDLVHKGIYALVTGKLVDEFVGPAKGSASLRR